MSVAERDPYTGHMTTGHEWNGIKELNTPVPWLVLFFLGATALFAIGYWIMMPAFPLGDSYTRGRLGFDQRVEVAEQLARAAAERADWVKRLDQASFADIQADEELMAIVRQAGPPLFEDNCAVCHGSRGRGGPGFPNLADGEWLWDNTPEAIAETLRVGINADHPQTRVGQMPGFGKTQVLDGQQVTNVVTYLRSLADPWIGNGTRAAEAVAVVRGAATFRTVCAACHGADGKGNRALGAPSLVDKIWLYGSDAKSLYATVWDGRGGRMPAWEGRLSNAERKIVTLYVLSLSNR